jgi:hypothetical protein
MLLNCVITQRYGYNQNKDNVSFCVLFVCKCVLYYCHRVATQLQLTNISIMLYIRRIYSLYQICLPVPVAAPSKACLRQLACWDCGFESPQGDMDVCLLWVLCIVRWRSLRRFDLSSRAVLPTVACRCVWSRIFEDEEAKVRYRAVKTQPQCVVTPGKETNKQPNLFNFALVPRPDYLTLSPRHTPTDLLEIATGAKTKDRRATYMVILKFKSYLWCCTVHFLRPHANRATVWPLTKKRGHLKGKAGCTKAFFLARN